MSPSFDDFLPYFSLDNGRRTHYSLVPKEANTISRRIEMKCYLLKHWRAVSSLFVLMTMIALPALAQSPTGSIRGFVLDQQGAVIPDAAVTVTNKATGDLRNIRTAADGSYSVENLLPGRYELKIEAAGFAPRIRLLTVQVGSTTSGDMTLEVGSTSVTVDVDGEAPIIDKTNYKIDGVINQQKINALPLNGRNFLQLALLEPGVSVSVSNPGQSNNLFNVSIGGGPVSLTRVTVDGGSVTDPVTGGAGQNFSTETIQEFQISTFNFDLSTGITSVGAINIVSRTGTNEYHGSAFLFYRDRNIAAFPTLNRSTFAPNPFFRRQQYGGSFGGPIKKDRAFFFGNVEWLNQDSAISTIHTGFRALSQLDTITTSPYDGVVANLRGDFRVGNRHNVFLRFSRDSNDTFSPDDVNTAPSNWRVNKNRDNNGQAGITTLFRFNLVNDFRFNYHRINNDNQIPTANECPPSNPGCIGLGGPQIRMVISNIIIGNSFNAPQSRIVDRYQLTDNLFWQKGAHRIRFGGEWEYNYGRGSWSFLDPAIIGVFDPDLVQSVNQEVARLPLPASTKQQLTIPIPPAFLTPGAKITVNDIYQLPIAIAFVGIGDPAQPPPFNAEKARRSHRYRLYWQDSWQMRRGFTLTYGASYQFESNLLNHDLPKPALIQPLVGRLDPPGKDKNNIAPALGFAWDIGGKGKTIIRGGAGIYYDTVLLVNRLTERAIIGPLGNGRSPVTGSFFQTNIRFPQVPVPPPLNQINPPLGTPVNFTSVPTKFTAQNFLDLLGQQIPRIRAQLLAAGSSGLTNLDFFKTGTDLLDPNIRLAYSEQVSVGVQRQLPNSMAISGDFVFRKRVHALIQNDRNLYNRAPSLGGSVVPRCTSSQVTNPNARCSNGEIQVFQSSGRDQYAGLLVKLDKRFSRSYQFTVSYALSSLTGFFTSEDLTNWFGYPGQHDRDARHRLTFSGVVDLPKGFQASLIAVFASPPPLNARVPANIDLNGDGTKGDTLPGLKINSLNRTTSKEELIALVNKFNQEFAGQQDAQGAIIPPLVLPSQFNFTDSFQTHDVRLSKTFKIRERYSIQLLGEVFNLFNISNVGGFTPRLDAGRTDGQGAILAPASFSFGRPTVKAGQSFGQGGPRAFQFGARISF
jgi:hypothetical protein